MAAARCTFPTLEDGLRTATQIVQSGVPVARCEFLDPASVRAVNAYSGLDLEEANTLFFEFHGSSAAEVPRNVRRRMDMPAEDMGGLLPRVLTHGGLPARRSVARLHDRGDAARPFALRKPGGRCRTRQAAALVAALLLSGLDSSFTPDSMRML